MKTWFCSICYQLSIAENLPHHQCGNMVHRPTRILTIRQPYIKCMLPGLPRGGAPPSQPDKRVENRTTNLASPGWAWFQASRKSATVDDVLAIRPDWENQWPRAVLAERIAKLPTGVILGGGWLAQTGQQYGPWAIDGYKHWHVSHAFRLEVPVPHCGNLGFSYLSGDREVRS